MTAKQREEEDKRGQLEDKPTVKQKNKTVLTLLDDRDKSLLPKGQSSTIHFACLGPCWFIPVQFPFPLLPCTIILLMYVPVRTSQGTCQV